MTARRLTMAILALALVSVLPGSSASSEGSSTSAAGDLLVADRDAFGSGGVIRVDPSTGTQTTVAMGGSLTDPWGIDIEKTAEGPPEMGGLCKGRPATIVGSIGDDNLTGTSDDDVIVGLTGNDNIKASGGDDLVCAGDGNDTVSGNAGNDKLFGEKGNDKLKGGSGNDKLIGGSGKDRCSGGGGKDRATCEKETGVP